MVRLGGEVDVFVTAETTPQRDDWAYQILRTGALFCGGGSTEEGKGYYAPTDTYEEYTRVFWYTPDPEGLLAELAPVLAEYQEACRQEAVLVVVNGQATIYESQADYDLPAL